MSLTSYQTAPPRSYLRSGEDRLYLNSHKHFFLEAREKALLAQSESVRVIKLSLNINYSFFFTFQNPADVFTVPSFV
jgi:hypothetical protein